MRITAQMKCLECETVNPVPGEGAVTGSETHYSFPENVLTPIVNWLSSRQECKHCHSSSSLSAKDASRLRVEVLEKISYSRIRAGLN
jgi:nitrate reductase cytochrome c-type subunit